MRKILSIIAFFSLFVAACGSSVESIKKKEDANYRLTKANEFYDKKQWYKANQLYATLIPVVRGTKSYEELLYRYAYSFYNMRDYLSASYQFRTLVDNFPTGTRAEEAEYLYALSLYKDAPKYNLDQTSTGKGVAALQNFVTLYRKSKYVPEANRLIDLSRQKLERKDADAAKLYFDMGEYRAARVSYKSLLDEYPESSAADYYYYMIVRSSYMYAKGSALAKQEERYNDVLTSAKTLKEMYPQSAYIKNAEDLSQTANLNIQKIRTDNEHK